MKKEANTLTEMKLKYSKGCFSCIRIYFCSTVFFCACYLKHKISFFYDEKKKTNKNIKAKPYILFVNF